MSEPSNVAKALRERLGGNNEDRFGKALSDLLESPLLTGAVGRAFDAREKYSQAQEVALGALNIPSAADIERLTRRLRSVSHRLEGIEDGLDRLDRALSPNGVEARLSSIEGQLRTLGERVERSLFGASAEQDKVPARRTQTAMSAAAKGARKVAKPARKAAKPAAKRKAAKPASKAATPGRKAAKPAAKRKAAKPAAKRKAAKPAAKRKAAKPARKAAKPAAKRKAAKPARKAAKPAAKRKAAKPARKAAKPAAKRKAAKPARKAAKPARRAA
jgi:hypothetical protein